jgi:uncharacterized membrane protein YgcG
MTGTGTTSLVTCDAYDIAQLAGGLSRVVDTAVVCLLEHGRMAVDGVGRLRAVGRAVHPVEAAVLELAGPRPRRTVVSLRLRAAEDPRLTGVAARLVTEGLLRRNPLAALPGTRPAHRCTAAGRQALAERRTPPPAPGSALDVALGGATRMADQVHRELVFGSTGPVSPGRRSWGRADAQADAGASGWALGGWGGGGWGGDSSGGFGGGDGGCGGGGGGDGGGC